LSGVPAWATTRRGGHMQGVGLTRKPDDVGMQGDYPGLGRWPKLHRWQRSGRVKVAVRLPGSSQITYPDYVHYTWFEAVDSDHHRYYQFLVRHETGPKAVLFRLRYWLYRRWIFHVQVNKQAARRAGLRPETAPARLPRPHAPTPAWGRLGEHARGEAPPAASLEQQLDDDSELAASQRVP